MRFLVDAQLPPALARWLASQNHEAQHVADIGMAEASDTAIWEKAMSTKSVIITKDEDCHPSDGVKKGNAVPFSKGKEITGFSCLLVYLYQY
jgi:predicted nuclease of predicted toxin-antitoxin system